MISDCEAVLCSRIGGGAEEALRKKGIRPIEAPDYIDDALRKMDI